MADDSGFSFTFPAIRGRKITAAFDGGRLTSDCGVLLLAQAERRLGIADRLAACIADPRDPGSGDPPGRRHLARPHARDLMWV